MDCYSTTNSGEFLLGGVRYKKKYFYKTSSRIHRFRAYDRIVWSFKRRSALILDLKPWWEWDYILTTIGLKIDGLVDE